MTRYKVTRDSAGVPEYDAVKRWVYDGGVLTEELTGPDL